MECHAAETAVKLHSHFRGDRFSVFQRPVQLEVHRGQLGLMWEHCRQDHSLVHRKQSAITTVFWDLDDDRDVGAIQRQALLNSLLDGVSVGGLIVLEAPDFGVRFGQVLVRVPVAIFERFDAPILLEAYSGLVVGSVDLVREVHVLLRPLLHRRLLLVPQAVNVRIDLVLVIIFVVILFILITFSIF